VSLLALKLVLTLALIAAASLAGRRWGHAVSGWLVGFPWTTGPVAFFVALERGTSFAAATAVGALAATIAEAGFCLAYAYVARRAAWPVALGAATVAFGVVGAALQKPAVPLIPTAAVVFAALVLALWLMPRAVAAASPPPPPRWDLPVRMVIATVLVFAITESAAALGPRWSGTLAAFPLYAALLTVFAHRTGPAPAIQVLRGLLWGLFGFAGFFVILAALIERAGVATAFAAACATILIVQGVSLRVAVQRRMSPLRAGRPLDP
jgi:hypothetical protein